ncbi:D-alanyl-D-alanine dipeptidase [Verrucomicrobium sp. GAS474]|uniref:M15 family metallopeptidase n=1 Tax=Verrucomicrobium sp. GAS474 TaxID=1882831 RepID=UPI00087A56EE|nr:M15 family metallopeptidase [Verrucomicrobium sp. GAS474]SDU04528.1 D-alanyl-D-alanine dipeptidase [Verrucomicrobium sp. GAS474]
MPALRPLSFPGLSAVSAFLLLVVGFFLPLSAPGAELKPRLHILSDPADYRAEVRADPSRRLVDLREAIPGLAVDLRYATERNFLHAILYDADRPLLRAPAAARLREVEDDLRGEGLGLVIYDAYRPYAVTRRMWQEQSARYALYLSPPSLGSDHNRGVAVDVGLVDLKSAKRLPMPTDFDAFTPKAAHAWPAARLSDAEAANRARLLATMTRHGFHPYEGEWWHYALNGAKDYSVLDLPLSTFEKGAGIAKAPEKAAK